MKLVDFHSHTTESDGTSTPEQLVREAHAAGVGTLAITDHDTMSAYEQALPVAESLGIRLIRGIELTCKDAGQNIHLLAFFLNREPRPEFSGWVEEMLEGRRDRNHRLAKRLQDLGLDVRVEEAERHGRQLTGRPHFARVLVDKGYAATIREAFDRYIGESGDAYVQREAPTVAAAVHRIRAAGGVSSLAHPIRVTAGTEAMQREIIAGFAGAGLDALEAYHTDQTETESMRFVAMAEKFGLAVTGGSDYHGGNKAGAVLGRCMGGSRPIPEWIWLGLQAA